MPKLATTSTLSDYPKISISDYKPKKTTDKPVTKLSVNYGFRGEQYSYDIPLTTTQPNFGGKRYWFRCVNCYRRVAVLYCAGLFVCRHCIGDNYQTQHLQPIDRLFKRVAVIRQRLGWYGGIAHGKGDRPRYMHHSTYQRLVNDHDRLEQMICGSVLNWLDNNKVTIKYE